MKVQASLGRASRTIAFALLTALGFFALINSLPQTQLRVSLDMTSTDPGLSQVFFVREGEDLSEQRSRYEPVRTGRNQLNFPLTLMNGGLETPIRFDPLDAPATLTITDAEIKGLFIRQEIPLHSFLSQIDVVDPRIGTAGLSFTTGSNDAQFTVAVNLRTALAMQILQAAILSLILSVAVLTAWSLSRRIRRRFTRDASSLAGWSAPRPPYLLIVGSVVVLVVNVGMLLIGSLRIGTMWDARSIVDRTLFFFNGGWFIEKYGFLEGVSSMGDTYVYAPFNGLIPHAVAVLAGHEPWLEVAHTAEAYSARNFAVALIALVGTTALAVAGRIILGSWAWAIVAGSLVLAMPVWTGQGMFNVKDVPVAAGYSLFTLGLIALSRLPSAKKRMFWLFVVSSTLGAFLAVGTRPGMWAPFALTAVVVILFWCVAQYMTSPQCAYSSLLYRAMALILVSVLAYALLIIMYPRAFADLPAVLIESVMTSADYPIDIPTLTAGTVLWSSETPWFYLPVWIAAQTPLLLGILALGLLLLGAIKIRQVRSSHRWEMSLTWLPVGLQAVLVPTVGILVGSAVFNGVRHVLFVFPALALLAAGGMALVVDRFSGRRLVAVLVKGVLIVSIAAPTFAQVRLFPYNFTYLNPVAAMGDVNGRWELDFQGVSAREILEISPQHFLLSCDDEDLSPESTCASEAWAAPYLEAYRQRPHVDELAINEVLLIHQDTYGPPADPRCTAIANVERTMHGQTVSLFSAYRCPVKSTE